VGPLAKQAQAAPGTRKRARPKRAKRRRRRRRGWQPPPLPKINKKIAKSPVLLGKLLEVFKSRYWPLQRSLVQQFAALPGIVTPVLHKGLQHPNARVRLLVAHTLAARRDPVAIPMLLNMATRMYDQPTPHVIGALMEYGAVAVPRIIATIPKTSHPQVLLKTLGYIRHSSALPVLTKYLLHPDKSIHTAAKEAIERYSVSDMTRAVVTALQAKPQPGAEIRSTLVRLLAYRPSAEGCKMLVHMRRDSNSSIRFLARISLEDQAKALHKATPKTIDAPPKQRHVILWQAWWNRNHKAIAQWYKTHQPTPFPEKSLDNPSKVLILYRTIHPMFGYGRMPIFFHDAAWKRPPAPIRGKIWPIPVPSKQYASMIQAIKRASFLTWPTKLGNIRDITLIAGKHRHRVSIDLTRFLPFERIEDTLVTLARKGKIGLRFRDFYNRRDEADALYQGKVGLWAYRNIDVLPWKAWSKMKGWRPQADIEGTWGALRDVVQFLPTRSRLVSLDMTDRQWRFSTLLYGSRSQSRMTRDGILRSRRFKQFQMKGLGNIYLSTEKIEQMNFDVLRSLLPQRSRSSARAKKSIPFFHMLPRVWHHKETAILKLRHHTTRHPRYGTIYQTWMRFKVKDTMALLGVMARLAAHSRGDRLITMRINQSGEADRDSFRLIVQMQWDMMRPLPTPKRLPDGLKHNLLKPFEPFQPVYR
jgi:hypothetical protein